MLIREEPLRGYILEEVLAYLIRTTGYELLVDPTQDPRELERRGNGLVIKGRGAVHQVDVLGELKWIPAFTFPLRLIVEAKFRKDKTGIDVVRNAVSVLLDVNQNNSPTREQDTFFPKYQYVYAIFSTSGFSRPAMDMAIAHQISLIDLSGSEYDKLKKVIKQSAIELLELIQEGEKINRGQLVSDLRYTIRKVLGTLPNELSNKSSSNIYLEKSIEKTLEFAREDNELFVGMSNGPFMLLFKPNARNSFLKFAKQNPNHDVIITRPPDGEDRGEPWKIQPTSNPNAYELSFKLPERLYKWIFEIGKERKTISNRALNVKQQYFSSITIYHYENEKDYLFRLKFDPEGTRQYIGS